MSPHIGDDDWRLKAACLDEATAQNDPWHPESEKSSAFDEAREFCTDCPVREACLKFALAREGTLSAQSRFGMYGGLTPVQRARRAGVKKSVTPRQAVTGERRAQVAELASRGLGPGEIALYTGMTSRTAARDLAVLRREGVVA